MMINKKFPKVIPCILASLTSIIFIESASANTFFYDSQGSEKFYAGIQAGLNETRHTGSDSNFASGVLGGYQFNKFSSLETEYLKPAAHRPSAINLLAKNMLTFSNVFSTYLKIGLAYETFDNYLTTKEINHKINPAAALGISYDITPNVPIDLSWTRLQRLGGSVPNSDFVMLGVSYRFG